MASKPTQIYDLVSCDVGSYPTITNLTSGAFRHSMEGQIVYLPDEGQANEYKSYNLTYQGNNTAIFEDWLPTMALTSLTSCADTNKDKIFIVASCADGEVLRRVLLPSNYAIGTVMSFTGEDTTWTIIALGSYYDESLTVAATYASCRTGLATQVGGNNDYDERGLSYAVSLEFPQTEPVDRGFSECCVSSIVMGDLSDTDIYKNDFTTVFYKRQTPSDTVVYKLIGVSTGTTTLVDGTHGTLYAYGGTEQPDLSYFRIEWRDVLSAISEDIYTIRKELTIAGVSFNIDSPVTYDLRSFSQSLADNTIRIDWAMDGKLVKIDTDFKNTNYTNSLRLNGFFGDRQAKIEQDNVVYSSKKGQPYFQDQITMSNNFEYIFQAYNLPECIVRPLFEEAIFANEFFLNDYNLNNHSYFYDRLPVILVDDNGSEYQVRNRAVNVNLTFADRNKNNRKTNC